MYFLQRQISSLSKLCESGIFVVVLMFVNMNFKISFKFLNDISNMPGWNSSKDYFHLPSLIIVEHYEWLSKLINV